MNSPSKNLSIMDEMLIDIHASKKRKDAWVVHDRPFSATLVGLDYNTRTFQLSFHFEDGTKRDLGVVIEPALRPYLEKLESVTFLQTEADEIVNYLSIPLKLTNH